MECRGNTSFFSFCFLPPAMIVVLAGPFKPIDEPVSFFFPGESGWINSKIETEAHQLDLSEFPSAVFPVSFGYVLLLV